MTSRKMTAVRSSSHSEMPSTPTSHDRPTRSAHPKWSTNWSDPESGSNRPTRIAVRTSVPPAVTRAWIRVCAQPPGASGTASIESAPSSGRSTMAVTQGIAGYRIARTKMTPTIAAPSTIAKA